MSRAVRYTTIHRFRCDPATLRALDECVRYEEEAGSPEASRSGVIRRAIAMYYKHHVRGYSFVNPNDPNYS